MMSALFLYSAHPDPTPPPYPFTYQLQKHLQIGLLIFAVLMASLWQGLLPIYAQTCTELLPDGSFEDGTGWTAQSLGNYTVLNTFHPRTGVQGAYLGGTNNAKDTLSTNPALPGDHTITLSFWWQVQSEESSNDWDGLSVVVADVLGTPLRTLLTLSDANATDTWQETTVDLTAYAGQVIQLQFAAQTDTTLVTDFFIDDVSIMACGRSTTPEDTTQTGDDVTVETDTSTNSEAATDNNVGTEGTPTSDNTTNDDTTNNNTTNDNTNNENLNNDNTSNPEGTPDPSVNPETSTSFDLYLPLLQR